MSHHSHGCIRHRTAAGTRQPTANGGRRFQKREGLEGANLTGWAIVDGSRAASISNLNVVLERSMKILYIEASPRKNRSASIEVARAALAEWQKKPAVTVDTLDVWSTELPEHDGALLEAKYAVIAGTPLTPEQAAAWSRIRDIAARFLAANVVVIATPMWNYSVPYKLKHLIDLVTQKDVLFTFDERGLGGLLGGRKALLIFARGLDYSPGGMTPAATCDFQKPYLETWLSLVGITDIRTVIVEKTLFGPDVDRAGREDGCRRVISEVREMSRVP
jgi:FMN-dependent NADH-azoreductase